jgi:hypothetical protein
MATILKLTIKNIYPNYQHYTDISIQVLIPSKVGLYRKKIFNPLDSSQKLLLLNNSLISSNVP